MKTRIKLHKKGVECFKIFHNDLNDSKKGVDHEPAHGMTQLRCMKYIIRHEREREGGARRRKPGEMCGIMYQPVTRGYRETEDNEEKSPILTSRCWILYLGSLLSIIRRIDLLCFMLTDDFITEVMSGLTAENWGETQQSSFQSWRENVV